MANWNNPTLLSTYTDFLADLKSRDTDAATMAESPTNPPTGYKRWNSTNKRLETWDGSAWVVEVLDITGGGTGANTQSGARTALGLGTLATQNSNAVSISGGTVSGLTSLGVSGNGTFGGLLIAGSGPTTLTNSAGQILETAIADGAVLARVGSNESIPGFWTFTNGSGFRIGSANPNLYFDETDAAADERHWRFVVEGGALSLQTFNDAFTVANNVFAINRTAEVVDNITFGTDVKLSSAKRLFVPAGTVSLPSFAFDGDTDTGLLNDSANSLTIGVGGVAGLRVWLNGGDPIYDPGGSGKWGGNFIPSGDNSFTVGRSDRRWDSVWAVNGTIQTSDIRHKNVHREIDGEEAVWMIRNLKKFVGSWRNDKDGRRFPALSAQDVQEFVDGTLGTQVARNDRLDCLAMNYDNIIPILCAAVDFLDGKIQKLGTV